MNKAIVVIPVAILAVTNLKKRHLRGLNAHFAWYYPDHDTQTLILAHKRVAKKIRLSLIRKSAMTYEEYRELLLKEYEYLMS